MVRKNSAQKRKGFTIVEILVVIVILGILASLSYFAFNSWRDRVAESELKSDLNGLYAGMESARNWSNGYPVLTQGATFDGNTTTKNIFKQSDNVTLTYYQGDSGTYCIDAVSKARPSISFFLNTANGNKEPKRGTCVGGEGAIAMAPGSVVKTPIAAGLTGYNWGFEMNDTTGVMYYGGVASRALYALASPTATQQTLYSGIISSGTVNDIAIRSSGELYIAGTSEIVKYDPATNTKTTIASGLDNVQAIYIEGNTAYIGSKLNLYTLDLQTNILNSVYSSVSNVYFTGIVKRGNLLYATSGITTATGKLYAFNLDTSALTQLSTVPNESGSVASELEINGSKLYMINGTSLVSYDIATNSWTTILSGVRSSGCTLPSDIDIYKGAIYFIGFTNSSDMSACGGNGQWSLYQVGL